MLKIVTEFTPGSRESELKIVEDGKVVLLADGYWDNNEDEWLSLDIQLQELFECDQDDDESCLAAETKCKQIVMYYINYGGEEFASVDELYDSAKNVHVYC